MEALLHLASDDKTKQTKHLFEGKKDQRNQNMEIMF